MPLSKKADIVCLAQQTQKHDEDAFARLYEATYQPVYYYILSLVRSEDDAQDLLQETFIQVFKDIGSLRDCKLVQSWIYRIAYHTCMRFLTRERPKTAYVEMYDEQLSALAADDPETDPLLRTISSERQSKVIKSLEKLSPTSKTVLLLKYFNGLKLSQIAAVLDCPVGTVKSRLNLAKKQLKKEYEKQDGGKTRENMFVLLPVSGALAASSKGAALSADAALNCLTGALGESGMSAAVVFNPTPFARPVNHTGAKVLTSAAAVLAAGTIAAALVPAAKIKDVSVADGIGKTIEIRITVSGFIGEQGVFCTSPDGLTNAADRLSQDSFVFYADQNGVYSISIGEGEEAQREITVTNVDDEGPQVEDYYYRGGLLTIIVSDKMSGPEMRSSYIETLDGLTVLPDSAEENELIFNVDEGEYYLHLEDRAGNAGWFHIVIK